MSALQMAAGGLLQLIQLYTATVWLHSKRISALSIMVIVETVLPFAVWYGRGERGVVRRRYGGFSLFLLLVCPKGFTLPTSSDYSTLTTTYNITNSSNGSTKLRQSPLDFGYTGFYDASGSLSYEWSRGYYWSRTANSGVYAYGLYFYGSGAYSQYGDSRGYGYALRCVGR